MSRKLLLFSLSLAAFLILQPTDIKPQSADFSVSNGSDSPADFLWTNVITKDSTYGDSQSKAIAIDAEGNSYITGFFSADAIFDTICLSAFGVYDVFIAKYDPNGYCVWAKHAGSHVLNSQSYAYNIAVDNKGSSYITGRSYGSVLFDSISLEAPYGKANIFTAKYSPEGKCLWARLDLAGGQNFDVGKGIAVDLQGNCYVTGSFQDWMTFGSFKLNGGRCNTFITKFDPDGTCLWAMKTDSNGTSRGNSISIYPSGNLLVTRDDGSYNTIISMFDPGGKCLWTQKPGTFATCSGKSIAVDTAGNSYITGSFSGTVIFGNIQLHSAGKDDMFIARYDPQGNCAWAVSAGGKNSDNGSSISVDPNGNSYVLGTIKGPAQFDSTNLNQDNTVGRTNTFIAEYDANGKLVWVKSTPGKVDVDGYSIASDGNKNLFITGSFAGYPAEFGTAPISGSGPFISKLSSSNTGIKKDLDSIPTEYSAQIYYPVTFVPGILVKLDLQYDSRIYVTVHDTLGKYVDLIFSGELAVGIHNKNFYVYNLPDGKYKFSVEIVSLKGNNKYEAHKVINFKKRRDR